MEQNNSRPGVDREWLEKTSKLSRLKLSEEELSELLPQLGQILDHVDQLRTLPTPSVEPFIHPLIELLPDSAALSLRSDEVRDASGQESISRSVLSAAPELTEGAFQVPQAVSHGGGRSS